jgi:hypothetical protein
MSHPAFYNPDPQASTLIPPGSGKVPPIPLNPANVAANQPKTEDDLSDKDLFEKKVHIDGLDEPHAHMYVQNRQFVRGLTATMNDPLSHFMFNMAQTSAKDLYKTFGAPVQGTPPSDIATGYAGQAGLPAPETATAETPGSITPGEFHGAAARTALTAGTFMLPGSAAAEADLARTAAAKAAARGAPEAEALAAKAASLRAAAAKAQQAPWWLRGAKNVGTGAGVGGAYGATESLDQGTTDDLGSNIATGAVVGGVGGLLTPVGMGLLGKAVQPTRTAHDPQLSVLGALGREGKTVGDVQQAVSMIPENKPVTLTDIGGDATVALARKAQQFAGTPRTELHQIFDARQGEAPERAIQDLEQAFGQRAPANVIQKGQEIMADARAKSDPLYSQSLDQSNARMYRDDQLHDGAPTFGQMMQTPIFQDLKQFARTRAANHYEADPFPEPKPPEPGSGVTPIGQALGFSRETAEAHDAEALAKGLPARYSTKHVTGEVPPEPEDHGVNARSVQDMKEALDDMINWKKNPRGSTRDMSQTSAARASLSDLLAARANLVHLMDARFPGYEQARGIYGGDAAVHDALQEGLDFFKQRPAETEVQLAGKSKAEVEMYKTGVLSALQDQARGVRDMGDVYQEIMGNKRKQENLRIALQDSPGAFETLMDAYHQEARMRLSGKGAKGGEVPREDPTGAGAPSPTRPGIARSVFNVVLRGQRNFTPEQEEGIIRTLTAGATREGGADRQALLNALSALKQRELTLPDAAAVAARRKQLISRVAGTAAQRTIEPDTTSQ